MKQKIMYTKTDESPAMATYALLPIVKAYAEKAGVEIELKDISLAGRIIATFPDKLAAEQKQGDVLAELGDLAKTPDANIIKLPNISASIPQLVAAIKELQDHGYDIPDYPSDPKNDAEIDIKNRYAKVLGSAVNPVLREGNSDRRVAAPVKEYAKKNPHSMGKWSKDSKSHVVSMTEGDFYANEKSAVMNQATTVSVILDANGEKKVLKEGLKLEAGEVIDASVMDCQALQKFFAEQIEDAKKQDVLLSLHMKATMMKVSDPIIFGYAVKEFYKDVFAKHAETFKSIGANPNNGIGDVYGKLSSLPSDKEEEIKRDLQAVYEVRPRTAMVDSDKGITNFHVPSDVIIDASMPAAIRTSGMMWGPDGKQHDTKYMIPDRSYSGIYAETINFCKEFGAFDVTTMGNVSNVGLMAKKAEEYGSHDKTFEILTSGTVRVVDANDKVIFEHSVNAGDIWRMCQTKDEPIRDWVRLGVARARNTGNTAIFWLDENRAHDAELIKKVNTYLQDHDTTGLDVKIMSPVKAIRHTMEQIKEGKDVISVTGNVLRDYLTDLFPIIELGTSAKMLSIVPLLKGGGLFETGAGGSAPKLVEQLLDVNHLRWDSLGEYLAIAVSLEDLGQKTGNQKALILAKTLTEGTSKFLDENKSPSRKVKELDNRGSTFYLAKFWAEALAAQSENLELRDVFEKVAAEMSEKEGKIIAELNAVQGCKAEVGGYYHPNDELAEKVMRPSATLNEIVNRI